MHTLLGGIAGSTVSFTMTDSQGSLTGSGTVAVKFKGAEVTCSGARVVRGAGRLAGPHASNCVSWKRSHHGRRVRSDDHQLLAIAYGHARDRASSYSRGA